MSRCQLRPERFGTYTAVAECQDEDKHLMEADYVPHLMSVDPQGSWTINGEFGGPGSMLVGRTVHGIGTTYSFCFSS